MSGMVGTPSSVIASCRYFQSRMRYASKARSIHAATQNISMTVPANVRYTAGNSSEAITHPTSIEPLTHAPFTHVVLFVLFSFCVWFLTNKAQRTRGNSSTQLNCDFQLLNSNTVWYSPSNLCISVHHVLFTVLNRIELGLQLSRRANWIESKSFWTALADLALFARQDVLA